MRLANVIGIVLSVTGFVVAFHYVELVWSSFWSSWDLDTNTEEFDASHLGVFDVSTEATLVLLLFSAYFVFLFIGNLLRVKTITSKVLAIIGLSLTGILIIILVFTLFGLFDLSIIDTGPIWWIFAPIALAFSIVLLVQTYVAAKRPRTMLHADTIDDMI